MVICKTWIRADAGVVPVTVASECPIKSVICKTWIRTLANSADPDQTPQNAASDQGLHCLLKLQEVKD